MCIADANFLFIIGGLITLISVTFIGYTKIKKSRNLKKTTQADKV